ncbi:MAG: HdeD family acid-resistance protein [Erysipelotrichaceae bacterium]
MRANSLITSICEIVAGILLLINPTAFIKIIIVLLGILLLLIGIWHIVQYFQDEPKEAAFSQNLAKGLIELIIGLFCCFNSNWFIVTFPIITTIFGVVILVSGIMKIQWTVDKLRLKMKKWYWNALSALLTVVIALIIIINPFSSSAAIWMFIAISLIVEAVVDVISMFVDKGK